MLETGVLVVILFLLVLIFFRISLIIRGFSERRRSRLCSNPPCNLKVVVPTIDKVLNEMDRPIRFSSQQLKIATSNFSHLLGAGGFGSVYKGALSSGVLVAVKVLNGSSDKKIEDQFLAEILGRRRNLDLNLPDSQEWFPKWVWKKFDQGKLSEVMAVCGIEEKDREKAGRMAVVALWCVEYNPEIRPWMSDVVKMLEGGIDIPIPKNPFRHFMVLSPLPDISGGEVTNSACNLLPGSSQVSLEPVYASSSHSLGNYEIKIATI
ncbi:hypothetical protein LguiA_007406 [Lonicera macranthoides]